MGRKLSLAALLLAFSSAQPSVAAGAQERVACTQPVVESARVVWITDGDTITVRMGERKEQVRLLGIDTPEMDDKRQPWRDQARAASLYVREQLKGRTVTLEGDTVQPDRDPHQRLLRFVFVDGRNLNLELVRLGYAKVYRKFDFNGKTEFLQAEAEASASKVGVWTLPPGPDRVTPSR